MAITFSQAGVSRQLSPAGLWVASLSEEERFSYFGGECEKTADWDDKWGNIRFYMIHAIKYSSISTRNGYRPLAKDGKAVSS
ncbi:hypothetical protein FHS16_004445 [Paenibacillus endophyticus]|uniref:Uncharacterized protein n=1 Tax=Paenibacillus endophyticus TaxID=1294268 RepID=A0A7W5CAY7_9BACL|nr:hypothetical protein [Paenibacillus endophyticus]MBB3154363.1 hypothetical protein [Paenibacillus endophyticus]